MEIVLPSLVILSLIGIYLYNKFIKVDLNVKQAEYNKEAAVLDFKKKNLIVETDKLKEELKKPIQDLKPNEVESFWDKK